MSPTYNRYDFLQLRVVKAFRSTLDEFEEKRSIASTQSCNSMRAAAGWSYLSLATTSAPRAAGSYSPDASKSRAALAALMQRASAPQPYPYYHHQQPRTPSPNPSIPNMANQQESSLPVVTENGRGSAMVGVAVISELSSPSPVICHDKVEKVPLVQRWSPSSGSSYSQRIGKSISLDTPLSIAHV